MSQKRIEVSLECVDEGRSLCYGPYAHALLTWANGFSAIESGRRTAQVYLGLGKGGQLCRSFGKDNRMKKGVRYTIGATVGIGGTIWLVSAAPRPAVPLGTPAVTVLNTAANPVPVVQQGAVSIAGGVAISGTPNFNVANTPNVNVASSAASPVWVKSVDSSRFQPVAGVARSLNTADDNSEHLGAEIGFYTVPAGKLLVIEQISGAFLVRTLGVHMLIANLWHGDFQAQALTLIPVHTGTDKNAGNSGEVYVISQGVKFYVPAGETVSASYSLDAPGASTGLLSFTGYLVDAL